MRSRWLQDLRTLVRARYSSAERLLGSARREVHKPSPTLNWAAYKVPLAASLRRADMHKLQDSCTPSAAALAPCRFRNSLQECVPTTSDMRSRVSFDVSQRGLVASRPRPSSRLIRSSTQVLKPYGGTKRTILCNWYNVRQPQDRHTRWRSSIIKRETLPGFFKHCEMRLMLSETHTSCAMGQPLPP